MMPLHIGQPLDHDFDEPLGLLSDCHRRIEYFLEVLVRLTQSARLPLTPEQWKEIEKAIDYFAIAAPRHTADEEESLFPRLRSAADPGAAQALECLTQLEDDHEMAEAHHRAVDRFCRRWLDHGFLSDADMRNLQDRLAELQAIYREHISIEDNRLFPAAAQLLTDEQLLEIGREMAARRLTR
jgi:hemerythrin-like domain-containing protein